MQDANEFLALCSEFGEWVADDTPSATGRVHRPFAPIERLVCVRDSSDSSVSRAIQGDAREAIVDDVDAQSFTVAPPVIVAGRAEGKQSCEAGLLWCVSIERLIGAHPSSALRAANC